MKNFTLRSLLLALCLLPLALLAQMPAKPSSSDLHQAIKKLNVLGSVLYVAAHPDDENQRLISYFANEKLYDVTYLALTRGDGGQNLIGPELRELLGVLRTEELLMARSVDGGNQRFTRANDFGYSKTPEETLTIWDKDAVLSDVVWTIRQSRPDIIINRFDHTSRRTHGHHTASAMLSVEAYDLAAKADAYPEQLKYTEPWQPRREFYNTSWWAFGGQEAFDKMDKSHLFSLDVGVYLPLKGKSNTEIAAEARSMHRCQSFGAMGSRGETLEWLDLIKGDRPKANDPFEEINTTWTRVEGGAPIGKLLAQVEQNFKPDNPGASVPALLQAMQLIKALPDGHWKRVKLEEIKEVIRGCLGLYLEATAVGTTATPGDPVGLHLECIYRAALPNNGSVVLSSFSVLPGIFDTITGYTLGLNQDWEMNKNVRLPETIRFTAPYWLLELGATNGMYAVSDQMLRGQPETPREFRVRWSILVNGVPVEFESVVANKEREPDVGEVWRPFDILPPVFVELTESFYLATGDHVPVTVRVKANRDNVSGQFRLLSPAGWPNALPADNPPTVELKKKGDVAEYTFDLQPRSGPDLVDLTAGFQIGDKTYSSRLETIKYDHIPQQYVLQPAQARAARVDLKVNAKNVGYYMGAGDDGPAALRDMGCTVTMLEDADLILEKLRRFDAVVLGIRAYNTKDVLKQQQAQLMEYVQQGGTLVEQYNTSYNMVTEDVGPYPIKLSRDRVTDETAEIRFLKPDHPALNTPNKITSKDFENWVQERGLYFPGEWDEHFTPLLSCNDPDESPSNGSLLVAPYGNGYFVYTGLSFFRQFPAGVPGAYRLFANLISLKMSP